MSTQYTHGPYLTVDEQLVPFRENCPFRQYLKSKPAKYGIKIWWAVDSKTWYHLNGQVYLDKLPNEKREINQGRRVLEDVTGKWLNKSTKPYIIRLKSQSSSPEYCISLWRFLPFKGISAIGHVGQSLILK